MKDIGDLISLAKLCLLALVLTLVLALFPIKITILKARVDKAILAGYAELVNRATPGILITSATSVLSHMPIS